MHSRPKMDGAARPSPAGFGSGSVYGIIYGTKFIGKILFSAEDGICTGWTKFTLINAPIAKFHFQVPITFILHFLWQK